MPFYHTSYLQYKGIIALGILKKANQHLVTNLVDPLPWEGPWVDYHSEEFQDDSIKQEVQEEDEREEVHEKECEGEHDNDEEEDKEEEDEDVATPPASQEERSLLVDRPRKRKDHPS